jgi:hypothetical protein
VPSACRSADASSSGQSAAQQPGARSSPQALRAWSRRVPCRPPRSRRTRCRPPRSPRTPCRLAWRSRACRYDDVGGCAAAHREPPRDDRRSLTRPSLRPLLVHMIAHACDRCHAGERHRDLRKKISPQLETDGHV